MGDRLGDGDVPMRRLDQVWCGNARWPRLNDLLIDEAVEALAATDKAPAVAEQPTAVQGDPRETQRKLRYCDPLASTMAPLSARRTPCSRATRRRTGARRPS